MKNIALSVLVLFAVSCTEIPTDPPYSPDNTGLFFTPESSEMSVGESVILGLSIEEIDLHFFGLTFGVKYDPEFLSYNNETGYTSGMGAIQFAQADSGIIYITISQTQGIDPMQAIGVLGLLEFTAVNTGACQVEYVEDYFYFYDAQGNEMIYDNHNLHPALIQIQ